MIFEKTKFFEEFLLMLFFFSRVAFVPNSPFLVTIANSNLYVWNLLTCEVWWSYKVRVATLSVDLQNKRFLVTSNIAKRGKIFFFLNFFSNFFFSQFFFQIFFCNFFCNFFFCVFFIMWNIGLEEERCFMILFSVESPVPLQCWKIRDTAVATYMMSSDTLSKLGSSASSCIVYLTTNQEIFLFEELRLAFGKEVKDIKVFFFFFFC
jgi:hypothetical protein